MEFKIGDKVRVNAQAVIEFKEKNPNSSYGDADRVIGYVGTIVRVTSKVPECYGIKFEGFNKGHNLSGIIGGFNNKSGWNVLASLLEHVKSQKANIQEKVIILINSKKKEVTCTYFDIYGNKSIAKANCSPSDLFNPLIGAQIALMRLAKSMRYPLVVDKCSPFCDMLIEAI